MIPRETNVAKTTKIKKRKTPTPFSSTEKRREKKLTKYITNKKMRACVPI
ncbi:MAG: hypothetical protein ACD_67C00067G0001 [uncultured bacterium]|nr:MAG: hypothetical protein ACD_67C00067G0001 [uncultured bacterium]